MSDIQKTTKNENINISKEDVLKYLPEKVAYEHMQTPESKVFQKEIKDLIKERRKILKEKIINEK